VGGGETAYTLRPVSGRDEFLLFMSDTLAITAVSQETMTMLGVRVQGRAPLCSVMKPWRRMSLSACVDLYVQLTSSTVASRIVPLTQFMPEKTLRAQADKAIAMLQGVDTAADESGPVGDRCTPKMQVRSTCCPCCEQRMGSVRKPDNGQPKCSHD